MEAPGLANQRAVRRHNLGVVLRHVSEHGPRSRATIALETGLNKTTVSSLVTELIGLDLLVERGLEQRGTVGRPGQVVELSGSGVVALGLEINVDYIAVRALDLTGADRHRGLEVHDNRRVEVSTVLDRLAGLASAALDGRPGRGPAAGGGDGGPPGARRRGERHAARGAQPRLERGRDRRRAAQAASPAPPCRWSPTTRRTWRRWPSCGRGPRAGCSDVLYVSGEIGVGAGIIVGGELFRGAQGFGGEFGHMTLDAGGKPCACGSRGCLETLAGLEALLEMAGLDPAAPAPRRARASRSALSRAAREG